MSILKYVKSIKFLLMCAFQRSYFMRNSNLRETAILPGERKAWEAPTRFQPRDASSPGLGSSHKSTTLLFTAAPLPRQHVHFQNEKLQAYQRAELQFEEQAKNGRAGADVGINRPGI